MLFSPVQLISANIRLQRHSSHRPWDFAVVNVSGHDDVSVADVTTTLDRSLGTDGACVGAAVNGCSGPGTDHQRRSELVGHYRKNGVVNISR